MIVSVGGVVRAFREVRLPRSGAASRVAAKARVTDEVWHHASAGSMVNQAALTKSSADPIPGHALDTKGVTGGVQCARQVVRAV